MQRRLETIDNVKVLMMLAVVLYHSCMFFTGSWFDGATPVYEASYLSIFARWLNTFHVQTFAMASGFLFYWRSACRLCQSGDDCGHQRHGNFPEDLSP